MKKAAVYSVCVVLALLGSLGSIFLRERPFSPGLNPQQLVELYYHSVAKYDFATARTCLSDEMAQEMYDESSDLLNATKLSGLNVSKESHIKLYGKNYDEVQVVAEYDAVYKRVFGSVNGHQIRFIYVGKKTKDAPWKIISIGTGP